MNQIEKTEKMFCPIGNCDCDLERCMFTDGKYDYPSGKLQFRYCIIRKILLHIDKGIDEMRIL